MHKLRQGIDIFLQQSADHKDQRIAFVTNDAATTSTGIQSRVALLQHGFKIVKLFSPEHGIATTGDDGVAQYNSIDAITGLPVISLYGDKMSPEKIDLDDIDLVLFDIPDVGCRFYTYLWTMTHVMEACTRLQKPLLVLDRPNPIGAEISKAEGPMLDEINCASFIGRWNIPLKHSCTLGELARYFAATRVEGIMLKVIAVEHYQRHYTVLNELDFVPTSPALQQAESVMLYPGTGLLEGVNVHEGRGTIAPFRICGAPWIDMEFLLRSWEQKNIPGIIAEATSYISQSNFYTGQFCHGLQFFITDQQALKPVAMGIALLQTLLQCYPGHCAERLYPTAANPTGKGHLDKLLGIRNSFARLKAGENIDTNIYPAWAETIGPYLLY